MRGLAYYSGNCWETNLNFKAKNAKGKDIEIGSCASGGRYNSLIKRFKGVDFKGTGMSIGIDRFVFALNQINKSDLNLLDFNKLPSWTFVDNKEIQISSTEIRNQRYKLRGKNY